MSERFTEEHLKRIASPRQFNGVWERRQPEHDLARELLEARKKIRGLEADVRLRDTAIDQSHANHLAECRSLREERDALAAKLTALGVTICRAQRHTEGSRIWGGMEWTYYPMAKERVRKLHEELDAALEAAKGDAT